MGEHKKNPGGCCTECGAEPSEVAAYPECTELARALHQRGRTVHVFPLTDFFREGGVKLPAIAMRVLSVGEEGEARDAAHKTRADQSKRAGDGAEAARKDVSGLEAEQNLEALFRLCLSVDAKGQPERFHAFPGVNWMRREFATDQQGLLLALYDELKRKHGPHPLEIDPEMVDAFGKTLAEHAGDDIPEALLAPYPRVFLTHLAVMLAVRLAEARRSIEVLLEQREAGSGALGEDEVLAELDGDQGPGSGG